VSSASDHETGEARPSAPAGPAEAGSVGAGSVGIVTRTRDRGLFVVRALASVARQTHDDWRIVLVNDGGDPGALRAAIAAAGLEGPLAGRLTIRDNPTSCGRAAAFNQGLAALETRFVACLDDDDSWDPDFLAALLALHEQNIGLIPDLGGVAAGVTALREDVRPGPDGRPVIVPLGEDGLPHAFHRGDFLIGPIAYATYRHDLYPVQWLLRRAAVVAAGGFPERFEVMEDRAFMLRFLQDWRIATLDRRLAFHHRRVRRTQDADQSAEMNTLDNPSYDWRRFADLALPSLTVPPAGAGQDAGPDAALPRLLRAVGASVVKEINDETSALWHKINGEAAELRSRLDALAQDAPGSQPGAPLQPGGVPAWSLWEAVGAGQIGFGLQPAQRFLGRLALSYAGDPAGLLLYADPLTRRFDLQIPRTEGWCALELHLEGLAPAGRDLSCALLLEMSGGGLFETGIMRQQRDALGRRRHSLEDVHVHRAGVGVLRTIPAAALNGGGGSGAGPGAAAAAGPAAEARLSIILPRQATHLRLCLRDLVIGAA